MKEETTTKEKLTQTPDFIRPVASTSVVPRPCSYQLWTDGKHLGEYRSWAASELLTILQHLPGAGLPLPGRKTVRAYKCGSCPSSFRHSVC